MQFSLIQKLSSIALITILLTSCSNDVLKDSDYPKNKEDQEAERIGKLTGEEGLVLFGGKKKSAGSEGINVNSYLWRATLDTIYFMPLISADPFGGTVLTDCYKTQETSKERFKLNVFIIGGELRSDAIRVTAFKQKLLPNGTWIDTDSSGEIAKEIEAKILLRARVLKFNS